MPHARPLLAPDLLKAFGIALVVFGHLLRGLFSAGILPEAGPWVVIDRLIYLFHMPLFFYMAGLFFPALYEKLGYRALVWRCVLVLLAPLVVWSYVQFSLQYAAGGNVNQPRTLLYVLTAPFPPRQQFWFLGALFLISCVVPLLMNTPWRGKALWACCAVLFVLQAVFWEQVNQLLAINTTTYMLTQTVVHLPFFLLGMVYGVRQTESKPWPAMASLAIFVGALIVYHFAAFAEGYVHVVTSILCVMALYDLALRITQNRSGEEGWLAPILFVGMNSMIIYLAHIIFMACLRVALLKLDIDGAVWHLTGGFLSGLFLPLLLVPLGLAWARRQPNLARAILPVRAGRP